ncbi:hypothetical protein WJ58_21665 [Burkholderia ubonensis]|uniref:immunity protein Imm33 domain-containing protein n=1 Tax=Burkholderia ubonensis TaxID=101571 RepID=UPI00075BD4CB|nr:hypothetical protein [Burkholderia ubonensis]KVM51457.1 hypothetical protein WJ58_21665 [Burkholderia ubonensis]
MANDKSSEILRLQKETCLKYGISEFEPESMVAVALETLGQSPVYGERVVLEEGEKISWFFYCGKFSEDKDFFKPVHTEHLSEILPNVLKFLRMPPGSGFVVDLYGGEEIWINENGSVIVKRI